MQKGFIPPIGSRQDGRLKFTGISVFLKIIIIIIPHDKAIYLKPKGPDSAFSLCFLFTRW